MLLSKNIAENILCKVMKVHRSGYCQWLHQPISDREQENQKLLIAIKELYRESGGVYGYRNIQKDLKELDIHVNRKRVARLMSTAKLYGAGTYKLKPKSKVGSLHKAHPNYLQQCFITNKPNESWVSDITYIRTRERWLYLATVIDLYSRKVIGWATGSRQTTSLIISAAQMATARLKKEDSVILHSDQGSQYSSYNYKQFAKNYNITFCAFIGIDPSIRQSGTSVNYQGKISKEVMLSFVVLFGNSYWCY